MARQCLTCQSFTVNQTARSATWSSELLYEPTDPGKDPRHISTLEPLWNIFDLTPEGRPKDWEEQVQYHCCL